MLSIILVETTGISKIQHCCGSTEIFLLLPELDMYCGEKGLDASFGEQHVCERENLPLSHNDYNSHECCCGNHPDRNTNGDTPDMHHHDEKCVLTDFLQLKPEQRQDSYSQTLMAFVPVELDIFDFKPETPVSLFLPDQSTLTVPDEAGRQKLTLYSIYLI